MTTPAINRDEIQYGDGTRVQTYADGSPPSTSKQLHLPWIHVTENRPESVNHPMNSSGWRMPTDWSHSGSYTTPYPAQAGFMVSGQTSFKVRTEFHDGAGWNGTVFGMPTFPGWIRDSAVNKALLRLKDQHVNLAVAFAERKETGELAVEAANRIVELIRRFQNRHKLSKQRVLSMTANSLKKRNTKPLLNDFLQVQYGVRPLMQDVYGATDALNKRERSADAYRATVHGACKNVSRTVFHKQSDYTAGAYFDVPMTITHSAFVRLDYVLENPVLATLAQLGITNPAELAWERVPFSFVIDWFYPVGNYLSAWDAALGWSFKAGSITQVSTVKGQATLSTKKSGSLYVRPIGNGSYTENRYRFVRTALSSSPLPRIPSFKNPLSGQHIANAIALAASRLR